MRTFDYIQDHSHGWVKVSMAQLKLLRIVDKITPFSYYKAGFAYLEEDCDLSTFLEAYRERYSSEPKFRDKVARVRRSRIRGYQPYTLNNVFSISTL
jgi:hypothetical protein